ncbi:MAG: 3'-5' exoribonuclease [Pseudomonadota bacterium]
MSALVHEGTYVVVDIEADGPDPMGNSMLSLAAVAVDAATLRNSGEFVKNMRPREDAAVNQKTLDWFAREAPEAYTAITKDPIAPADAMAAFISFVKGLPAPQIFVAHPVMFDGAWVDRYLGLYTDVRLFDHATHATPLFCRTGLDLPSLVMGVTGRPYPACHRGILPTAWFGDNTHRHDALSDALGYSELLRTVLGGSMADGAA